MYLHRGNTRSCGCSSYDAQKEGVYRLEIGVASRNALFSSYKIKAKERGLDWNLDINEFQSITKQNCHYCGVEPKQEYGAGRPNGSYTYNGIDRVDNDLGYIKGNCVPCCIICNIAKHNMTKDQFLDWIRQVYIHSIVGELV